MNTNLKPGNTRETAISTAENPYWILRAIYFLALEITPATTDTQTQTHKN